MLATDVILHKSRNLVSIHGVGRDIPVGFEGSCYDVTDVTRSGGDGLGLTVIAQAGFNIIGTL